MTLAVQEAASLMNSLNSRACVLRLEAQGYQRQSRLVGKPGPGRACLRCKPTAGGLLLSKHCQIVTQDQRGSEKEIRY